MIMKYSLFFCTLIPLWSFPASFVVVASSSSSSSPTVYTATNGYMPITTNSLTFDPWPYIGISSYGLQAFYEDMRTSILYLSLSSSSSSSSSTTTGYTYQQLQTNPFLYCLTYHSLQQGIDQCTSLAVQKGKERISSFYYNTDNGNTSSLYYDVANIFGYHTWTENYAHFIHNLGTYTNPSVASSFSSSSSSSSSSTIHYYYFDVLSEIQQNSTLYSIPPWLPTSVPFMANYPNQIDDTIGIYHIPAHRIDTLPTELREAWCPSSSSSLYRNASTVTCYLTNTSISSILTEYANRYPSFATLNPYVQQITQSTHTGTNLTLITTTCIRSWLLASLNRTFNSPAFTTPIVQYEPSSTSTLPLYGTSLPITSPYHPDIHRLRLKLAFSHLLMDAGKYLPAIQLTIHTLQSLSSIIMTIHRNIDALNNTLPFSSVFALEQLFFNAQIHLGFLFDRYDHPHEAKESFRKSIDGLTKSLKKYNISYGFEPSVWQVYGDTLLSMRTSLALSLSYRKETLSESVIMGESIVNDTIRLRGNESLLTAFVLNNYGYFLNQNQSYDKAEPILRHAYDIYARLDPARATVPPYSSTYNTSALPIVTNVDALRTLSNLATALEHRYKYNESEYFFRIVNYNRELHYGPYHSDSIKALLNLAACLKRYGFEHKDKMNEASDLFYLAYQRKTFIYGTFEYEDIGSSSTDNRTDEQATGTPNRMHQYQSIDNYNTLAMYADTLMENGNNAEALEIAQKAHQGLIRIVGENHTNVLMLKETMAACYHSLDRKDEALNLFEYILERREDVFGKNDSHSIRIRRTIGAIYVQNRNMTEAMRYLKELITIMEDMYGPYHTDTLKDSEDYTNQLFAWNFIEEAEIYQKKVYKGYQKIYGPKHEKTLRAQSNLGSMTVLLAMEERNREIKTLQQTGKDYLLYSNPDAQNLETGGIPFMQPAPIPGEENGATPPPSAPSSNAEYESDILFRRAEHYLKQAYLGRNETIGLNNKDTIHTMTELATMYLGDENYRTTVRNPHLFKSGLGTKEKHYEAIQLYRLAMNAILQLSSTSEPETLRIMYNYATALYTYEDSTIDDKMEAMKTYRTVAEYRRLTTGKENPDTLMSFTRLATALVEVSEEIYQTKFSKDQASNSREEFERSIEDEEEEEDKVDFRLETVPSPSTGVPVPSPVPSADELPSIGTAPTPPQPTPKVTIIKVSPSTKEAYHQSVLAAEEAEALAREAWDVYKIRIRNMRMSEDMDEGIPIDKRDRKNKKKDIQIQDTDNIDRSPKRLIKEVEPLKTLYIIARCILKQKKEEQYKEAEKFSRMVAKSRKALLGPKHPDTAEANKLLFDVLSIQGKVPTEDKQYIEAAMAYM